MRLAKDIGTAIGWGIIAAALIIGLLGLALAQSPIDENYRCTDLIHACLYDYEATDVRELELQVGKRTPADECGQYRLWFLIKQENPWPSPFSWYGDSANFDLEESDSLCHWTVAPSFYEDLGELERVGFEARNGWVIGRADLTNVLVPAPEEDDEDEIGRNDGGTVLPPQKPYNPCEDGFPAGTTYRGQCHGQSWPYYRYDAGPSNRQGPGFGQYKLTSSEFVCGTDGSTNNAPGDPLDGWYCTGNAEHEWAWVPVR